MVGRGAFHTKIRVRSPYRLQMICSSNGKDIWFSTKKYGFDSRTDYKILASSLDGKSVCLIHMREWDRYPPCQQNSDL